MNPWWALEDPTVNGPDDDDETESSSDDRATCDLCGDPYEVWTDPADGYRVTWCCETCWAKPEQIDHEQKENAA